MKKIIKEAEYCIYCDCVFTYDPEDIEQEPAPIILPVNTGIFKYVTCPVCGARMKV